MLNPDVVVVACNTASTIALDVIRDVLNIPVIGVVPAIKPAAESSRMGAIGVLGTPGTVKQKYVNELIADFAADCRVVLQGSTRLVTQAERKLAGQGVDMDVIREEVAPIFAGRTGMDIDAVVLACTHFPLLRDELKQAVRQTVHWVDSGEAIARRLEVVLNDVPETIVPTHVQMAFLVGHETDALRQQAFAAYGFSRTIGLMRDERPIGEI